MALKPCPLAQTQMILKYLIETYPFFLFNVLIARLSILTTEIIQTPYAHPLEPPLHFFGEKTSSNSFTFQLSTRGLSLLFSIHIPFWGGVSFDEKERTGLEAELASHIITQKDEFRKL